MSLPNKVTGKRKHSFESHVTKVPKSVDEDYSVDEFVEDNILNKENIPDEEVVFEFSKPTSNHAFNLFAAQVTKRHVNSERQTEFDVPYFNIMVNQARVCFDYSFRNDKISETKIKVGMEIYDNDALTEIRQLEQQGFEKFVSEFNTDQNRKFFGPSPTLKMLPEGQLSVFIKARKRGKDKMEPCLAFWKNESQKIQWNPIRDVLNYEGKFNTTQLKDPDEESQFRRDQYYELSLTLHSLYTTKNTDSETGETTSYVNARWMVDSAQPIDESVELENPSSTSAFSNPFFKK